ncbi:MAG: pyridoxal-phosphate dependent enzyme [Acidobacteriota bacterium]
MIAPPNATALPSLGDIRKAAETIASRAHRTPLLTSRALDDWLGARLFFKVECFQKAGAFKFRGACNTVFSLSEDEVARGVLTHSSGNHGAALALAARLRGARSWVVMPRDAPQVKQAAMAAYGATLVPCEPTPAAREATAAELLAETGATFVHPFDDVRVIAGQGTVALEILDDVDDLSRLIVPVGGGGLLSGTAIAVTETTSDVRVEAAEPLAVDDAARSFTSGERQPAVVAPTLADGLRTGLSPRTFRALRERVSAVMTVSEEAIVKAMRMLWERLKVVVEPSAAVPVAALLEHPPQPDERIAIVLTGGNVDLERLPWIDQTLPTPSP